MTLIVHEVNEIISISLECDIFECSSLGTLYAIKMFASLAFFTTHDLTPFRVNHTQQVLSLPAEIQLSFPEIHKVGNVVTFVLPKFANQQLQ